MVKETIKVGGMSCGHCVSAVEGSVKELDGISAIKVSLDEGVVAVEFDPALISLDKIKEAIDEQGYDVA
jgi:copper chaperone